MDRLIYTALTGMRAREAAQAVTANNLANANVTGFRRELSSLASRYLSGPEDATRIAADEAVTTASMAPGRIAATGQPLDIAVDGDGWLAVQAADGSEGYTRRGDLRVAASGVLETGDGFAVLGNGGVITVPPGVSLSIGADGTVSARLAGAEAVTAIDRIKLVAPAAADLRKGADGLFRTPAPAGADPAVRVQAGALEGANVDPARGLVELIEQARGFEVNAKLLSAMREIDEGGTRLMRADG